MTRSIQFPGAANNEENGGHVACGTAFSNLTLPFTIEFWARPQNGGSNTSSSFISVGLDGSNRFYLDDNNRGNRLRVYSQVAGTTVNNQATADSLPWDTWTHVAVVYQTNDTKVYINGALDSTFAATYQLPPNGISRIASARFSSGWYYYTGNMQEVRIWSTARTQQQIQDNRLISLQSYTGLVAYYPMQEESGTTVINEVGTNASLSGTPSPIRSTLHAGVIYAPPPPPPPPPPTPPGIEIDTTTQGSWLGKYGSAGYRLYSFAAAGTHLDSSPALPGITQNGGLNHNWATGSAEARAIQHPNGSPRSAACYYTAGTQTISVTPTENFKGFFRIYLLDWDSQSRTADLQLSVDGVAGDVVSVGDYSQGKWVSWEVDCPENATMVLTATNTGPQNVTIGALALDYELENYHEEVLSDNPIAYWTLGDSSGPVIDEISDREGVIVGSPQFGRDGALPDPDTAIGFPNVIGAGNRGHRIEVADASALRLTTWTVECWAYFEQQQTDWVRLVGKGIVNDRNYGIWVGSGGELLAQTSTHNALTGTGAVPVGQWVHIVGTFDGSTVRAYLNGTQRASGAASAGVQNAGPLTIGAAPDVHAGIRGRIDEPAVYNYALSPQRVMSHFVSRSVPRRVLAVSGVTEPVSSGSTVEIGINSDSLKPDTQYIIRAKAIDPSNEESSWTNLASFRMPKLLAEVEGELGEVPRIDSTTENADFGAKLFYHVRARAESSYGVSSAWSDLEEFINYSGSVYVGDNLITKAYKGENEISFMYLGIVRLSLED